MFYCNTFYISSYVSINLFLCEFWEIVRGKKKKLHQDVHQF